MVLIDSIGIRAGACFGIDASNDEVFEFAGRVGCGCDEFLVFGGWADFCIMCT